MGTDIHIRIQRQNQSGEWEYVPYVEKPLKKREELDANDDDWRDRWEDYDKAIAGGALDLPDAFTSRNYHRFGLLADVRNGHGFAGLKTGEGWPAQFPYRGLPGGIDPDTDRDDFPWLGEHSYTWCLLSELEAVDWTAIQTVNQGVLSATGYEEWDGHSWPPSYRAVVSGPSVRTYQREEWENMGRKAPEGISAYVEVQWQATGYDVMKPWIEEVFPILRKAADGHPLRLLIGFDS